VEQQADTATSILANGLSLIEISMPHRPETAIGIAFPGGARQERQDEVGVAHLLEHMVFKGTQTYRTSRDLSRSAERLGAELNGCTTDDYVELTALVLAESSMPAIGLLAEVAGQALLEEHHLETERAVVSQEIADGLEDPSTVADYRLIAALFRGHRLATPTVGHLADVAGVPHTKLVSFRERQWSPAGGLFVVAGNLEYLDRAQLRELLLRVGPRPAPPSPPPFPPFIRRIEMEERESEVAHLRLGYEIAEFDLTWASDRAVAEVFCDVLGGSPGSRLAEELREQRGLCYEIESYWWGYRDRVLLSVDCSVQSRNVAEAYRRIDGIVRELSTQGPTEEESQRARSYAIAASTVSLESPDARAERAVYLVLQCGDDRIDSEPHLRALRSVTREDLAGFAARVLPGPCVGCVGAVTAGDFE
jgi:predicted Zn-dependent peptidase